MTSHLYRSIPILAKTRNLSSHMTCSPTPAAVAQRPHACDRFRNRVTLTFDLLTSGSMHAEQCHIYSVCVPSLVLIAQAVFTVRCYMQRGISRRLVSVHLSHAGIATKCLNVYTRKQTDRRTGRHTMTANTVLAYSRAVKSLKFYTTHQQGRI